MAAVSHPEPFGPNHNQETLSAIQTDGTATLSEPGHALETAESRLIKPGYFFTAVLQGVSSYFKENGESNSFKVW